MNKREFDRSIVTKANKISAQCGLTPHVFYFGRPFGWDVYLVNAGAGRLVHDWRVAAGCRWFTFKEARKHWAQYAALRGRSRTIRTGPFSGQYLNAATIKTCRNRGRGMLALVDAMEASATYTR